MEIFSQGTANVEILFYVKLSAYAVLFLTSNWFYYYIPRKIM